VEIAVKRLLLETRRGMRALIGTGAGKHHGAEARQVADNLRAPASAGNRIDTILITTSPFRPFQRIGRRRRARHLSQPSNSRVQREGRAHLARSRATKRAAAEGENPAISPRRA